MTIDRTSPISSDLSALATERAAEFAAVLHQLFVSLHFDVVNRELRLPQYGGDYDVRPFPLPNSPFDVGTMKVRLRQGVKTSPTVDERRFARRIQYAFMFFMFGEALPLDRIEELFGDRWRSVDEGLELGLFIRTEGQTIRMNGLSLFSRHLSNGEVVHLFADTPPHFQHRMAVTPRVYIGADSYELMDRVSALAARGGACVEMGSGSGIQLVSALTHHPRLLAAVGKEHDRRAVNVSLFNAALNRAADRTIVVGPEGDLRETLQGRDVAFAITNPPFLAVPKRLDVGADSPIDLQREFPSAGWGGEDGLEVTRQFIEELQSILSGDAPLVIYSQFAGNDRGPTHIRLYAERAGFNFSFEPLPSRPVFVRAPETSRVLEGRTQPVLSASQAAAAVARLAVAALLAKRQPQKIQTSIRRGSSEYVLLLELAERIEASYRNQEITHFHDGFAILARSDTHL